MPELVTIAASFIELTVDYERAALGILVDRASFVQGIFDSLKPWNPTVDDIETLTAGKHSEQGVMFRIPLKRASFFVGPAFCRFGRDDADWAAAEETISIVDAAISALAKINGIAMAAKRTVIGMHLQPRKKTFMEILDPFMPRQLASLDKGPIQTMAVVAKWQKRKVTLDGSAMMANAVFVKIERDFESTATYADIATRLWADQQEVFNILGVEEDRG